MKYAVIYARYSSAKQNDESIEQQLQKAHRYAAEKGYTVIGEYCDRAVSGRSDDRDEFQRMLRDAKNKKFQVVITWKIDRFGRNRFQLEMNKYELKKHGVSVEYVAENIPEGNEGILLEAILEGMAEYYSSQLSSNVKRGMLYNAQQGKVTGPVPFGYKIGADKRIEIDESSAPAIRKIFSDCAAGKPYTEICAELNALGFRTAKGNLFGRSSLHRILHCEKYIGRYTYKTGTPDEVVLDDFIPPLIDARTFEKCQKMVKNRRRGKRTEASRDLYILSGKLFCGKCGESMQGMSGNGRHGTVGRYYRCYGKVKGGCTKRNARCDLVEDAVVSSLLALISDDDLINAIADRLLELYALQNKTDIELFQRLKAEFDGIPQKVDKLLDLLLSSDIDKDTLTEKIKALEARKTALQEELRSLSSKGTLTKAQILGFFGSLKSSGCRTDAERRALVHSFVNRIYLYDDKVVIYYNFVEGDGESVPLPPDADFSDLGGSVVKSSGRVTICTFYEPHQPLRLVAFVVL